MRDLLSRLRQVKRGELIENVVTADYLNAINDSIKALARGDNIQAGLNVRRDVGPDYIKLSLANNGSQKPATQEARKQLELIVTTDPASTVPNPPKKIRVVSSTIAGGSSAQLGFSEGDDPWYLLNPMVGVVQAGITIDQGTGLVTSRWIEIKSEIDEDTDDTFYVEIGTVTQSGTSWAVSNSRYGPISAYVCRNWFAAEAPFYGVTWI